MVNQLLKCTNSIPQKTLFVTPFSHSHFGTFSYFLVGTHQDEDKLLVFWEAVSDAGVLLGVSLSEESFTLDKNARSVMHEIRAVTAANGIRYTIGFIVKVSF
jgi:hypothetical protein